MKKIIILFTVFISFNSFSQSDTGSINKSEKKYGAWFSPSNATNVYGLMFNVWPKDHGPYPEIDGVEFNINPPGIFAPFLCALYTLDLKTFMLYSKDECDTCSSKTFKKVNGLQIGFMNMERSIINGLDINASGSYDSKTNGVTLSLASNHHFVLNGLTVAAICNADNRCNGVQLSLINFCEHLKGFQFGLWNKNQKRSLPIINWCFKA